MPDLNAKEMPSGTGVHRLVLKAFQSLTRRAAQGAALAVVAASIWSVQVSEAAAENRSLKLYFIHTGEKAEITFKRNGRFDPKGLQQINNFLRDWRKNEPTKMDPRLFDLVWEVYRRSGAKDYIHVVSAYRSPTTNGMLRGRSRNTGVAKNSQHMLGKAMDFYIPGVKLATLRALAMQMQVGGVGFYPTSGSPFVHLDVGGVRAWPRMSRQELVQIFPKGNTLHLPADGQPLPGYDQALADYKKRVGSSSIEIASTAGGAPAAERKRRGFLATLFGGGADEEEDNGESSTPAIASPRPSAPASRPAAAEDEAPAAVPLPGVMVASAQPQQAPQPENITAPVPASRPAFRQDGPGALATALYSQQRNPAQEALALQAAAAVNSRPQGESFEDLTKYAVPVPTLLGSRGTKADADTSNMMASLGDVPPSLQDVSGVPLPAHRPVVAQVAAMVPAPQPAERARENEQALTPELVAALSRSVDDDRRAAAGIRAVSDEAGATPAPVHSQARKPTEVAALPKKVIQAPSASGHFGDGFDTPKWVAAAASAVPTKGGRSTKPDLAPASGNLTKDKLEKWALDNKRSGDVVSMKAPRVVTRTLNSEYSAAYASEGFKPVAAAVKIDPNRFSGSN
ncbi:Peptidase M15 [compost metagenome]